MEIQVFAAARGIYAACDCGWRTEGYDQNGISVALEKAIELHESETSHCWRTYGEAAVTGMTERMVIGERIRP